MKLSVVAIGQRLPAWAEAACADYAKRFPPELRLEVKALKAAPRQGQPAAAAQQHEGERIAAAIGRGSRVVVLDERGTALTSAALAARLQAWQSQGDDVALVVGGADGLTPGLRASAHECLRLSDLTLPHALARVLLIEQLYRAWSINAGHPYHRE